VSFLRRLRNLTRLTAAERRLAVSAVGTLALARVALATAEWPRVRRLVDSAGGRGPLKDDPPYARAVSDAMLRAARLMPGARCLPQALAAEVMLRRAGRSARTSIGVALDGAPLAAHAWVESAGVMVTGDIADLGKYQTLVVFGGDEPLSGGE
jgi:hypothetical protein